MFLDSRRAALPFFSDTQISLLHGLAFALLYTLLGLPIGRLADRYNRKLIIATGIFLWSIMTATCGLAQRYAHLFLSRIGVGVGEAALSPAAYSLIADYFERERRATALSVYSMGIYIGSGIAFLLGAVLFIPLAPKLEAQDQSPRQDRFVAHEWGTFTSVSTANGNAQLWNPLVGPSELPSFVYRSYEASRCFKSGMLALVRMETPVIYFYSGRDVRASVKVDFPRGCFTEWYPLARAEMRTIDWNGFTTIGFPLASLLKRVEPNGQAKFVEFTTLLDPSQFPGQKTGLFGAVSQLAAGHGDEGPGEARRGRFRLGRCGP